VVTAIKWIPGEENVVQCSEDTEMRVWDARTGAVAERFPKQQYFPVSATREKRRRVAMLKNASWTQLCCDVSPDGHYILTGDTGKTISLDYTFHSKRHWGN